jgi:hypothetical protein
VYCEIDLTRRFEYENQSSDSDQKRGTFASGAPEKGSGGLVWKPNSVFQIGSFGPLILPRGPRRVEHVHGRGRRSGSWRRFAGRLRVQWSGGPGVRVVGEAAQPR